MRLAAVAAAALVAGLPQTGRLVPDRSLAGIRIDETQQQVTATLGRSYGVCLHCARTTWYYNVKPFDQHGLGIEFTRGLVSAVYTIFEPSGWLGPRNLALGETQGQVTTAAGPLVVLDCAGYAAWVADGKRARTVYYLLNGTLWGFGLVRPHANPCR